MSWLALGSAALGSAAGFFGQKSANKQNLQIAREQMAFQERMSNTAYTRAARDLENAGLNRILALGSPASSPGGASAVMGNVGAAAADGMSTGAATALAYKRLKQELRNMKEVEKKDWTQAGTFYEQSQLLQRQQAEMEERIKLLQKQQPGAEAEAKFWEDLNNGKLGSTAKGVLQFAPLLRIIRGK